MHTVGIVLAVIGALVLFWLQWELQVGVLWQARKAAAAAPPRQ